MGDLLRSELQRITFIKPSSLQPAEVEKLRSIYRHSISIHQDSALGAMLDFNCVAYALNLAGCQKYEDWILRLSGSVHADIAFLERLVAGHDLLPVPGVAENCLVTYCNAGKLEHVGKVLSQGRCISKWGTDGLLWEHSIEEVPLSYGEISSVRYYLPVARDVALGMFKEYVLARRIGRA